MGGLVPYSDGMGYFRDAIMLALTGEWGEMASRRPSAAALRQVLALQHTLRASARSQPSSTIRRSPRTSTPSPHAADEWRYARMSRPFVRVPVARTRSVPDAGYAAFRSATPGDWKLY
jgi:hypothetical protein